jgi:hypothetical protein
MFLRLFFSFGKATDKRPGCHTRDSRWIVLEIKDMTYAKYNISCHCELWH